MRKGAFLDNQDKTSVRDIATLTFARFVVNMTRRFPYAFLPAISRSLDVPLDAVQNVMAANAGVGVASPLVGAVGERYGRKRVIMAGLLVIVLASLVGAIAPKYALFAGVMVAYGAAKMIFDPAILAFVGDHVSYARRGSVIGLMELSWAASLLVIAPLAGFLLGASGLQSVFIALAMFNLLALAAVWRFLPADHPIGDAIPGHITPAATWRALRTNPASFGALGHLLLVVIANEVFFINYSAYMESTFNLALTALGTVTIVVALAEGCGELAVAGLADRLGKRRLTLIGIGISSLGYVLLPALSFSLPLTLGLVFLIFLNLEMAVVAAIPLFTEILPGQRGIMMSAVVGTGSFGRLAGATFGGWLYATLGSFAKTSAIATGIALMSWLLLWLFLHEKSQQRSVRLDEAGAE
jgi:predicted MFS family arabinose efflux permease